MVRPGTSAADYAADLVGLARAHHSRAASGLGAPPVVQRVEALLADRVPVPPSPGRKLALTGVLGLLAVGLGLPPGTRTAPAAAVAAGAPADLQAIVDAEASRVATEWSAESVAIVVVDVASQRVVSVGTVGDAAAERRRGSGSVLKPFVALAALQAGVAPDNMPALLEVSDNPGFVDIAEAVGPTRLIASYTTWGLPVSSEATATELALGQVPTSTRELALAYARLPEHPHGPELIQALTRVVEGPRGTGRAAATAGVRVAGKTGTAVASDAPTAPMLASFVGVFPAEAPRWAVAVQVAARGSNLWGGKVAAPAFSRVAAQLP